MVRIAKRTNRTKGRSSSKGGFLSQVTLSRHYLVLIQLALIFGCFGFYLLLKSKEDKQFAALEENGMMMMRGKKKSSSTTGIADAAITSSNTANDVHISGIPYIVYGTAWKKERTATLVNQAVHAGFRFIDTACQPKHYNEKDVGNGWSSAANELNLSRDQFFIQSKFTSVSGQDPNTIPYDETATLEEQVQQSLDISLKNLHTTYLDSWVIHGPERTLEQTMIVWRVMEQAVTDGKVKYIGISNMYNIDHFKYLYNNAIIKPSILQNRFYEQTNWDTELRIFCKEHNIKYQSFWTLTANRHALAKQEVTTIAESKGLTPQTLLYGFLMQLGYVTPLSGTTSLKHMAEDIAVMERIQNGEKFFTTNEELYHFAQLLGLPDL